MGQRLSFYERYYSIIKFGITAIILALGMETETTRDISIEDGDAEVLEKENRRNVWTLRSVCMITGASRGLGHRMAVRFAERLPLNSVILLVARDKSGISNTAAAIAKLRPDVRVSMWSVDLSEVTESIVSDYLAGVWEDLCIAPEEFEQAILVHNAGSTGNISEWLIDQSDAGELDKYWRLNLTSPVILNAVFWKFFVGKNTQRVAINISSLCAQQAFRSWSLYCAGMFNALCI